MAKKKSSFHMGDEFNGSGKKTYLRATQHNTYAPLPQHNVRLIPNFSRFVPVAIGGIPISTEEGTTQEDGVGETMGSVPNVSKVEVRKKKNGKGYRVKFEVGKIQLTDGAYLHSKATPEPKTDELLEDAVKETVTIAEPWLIGYMGEPTYNNDDVIACIEGEGLLPEMRDKLGDENEARNEIRSIDWYSYEDYVVRDDEGNIIYDEQGNTILTINKYAVKQFENDNEDLVMEKTEGGGFVNEEGRYWVAVGPEILRPGYNTIYPTEEEQTLAENHFHYGTKIDVILQHMSDNSLVYIQCVAGDVMGHTYPYGVFQTGDPYRYSPNKDEDGSYARNGAYIEFINAPTTLKDGKEKRINGTMSKYVVKKIIVYQREWHPNYD